MKIKQTNEQALGIAAAVGAYFLWGILPVYWKIIKAVPPYEILAHRFVWAFVFMVVILIVTAGIKTFFGELRELIQCPKRCLGLLTAAVVITINWGTYIWAVNNDHVIQTSLGYYINPLISVMLGVIVLKERLSLWQLVSFLLAGVGVLNMAIKFGSIPWVSLVLAFSFGIYGLLKKKVNLSAVTGITLETLLITPLALTYLAVVYQSGNAAFNLGAPSTMLLLIGSGVVTAVPLLLFSRGAKSLPLSVLGFLQYIAPTMTLFIGVFIYHEPFTAVHMVSFAFIWTALSIFSLARTKRLVQLETVIIKKFSEREKQFLSR